MTTLRLSETDRRASYWTGSCGATSCDEEFEVISDNHQTKVEVLSILASPHHRDGRHLHGTQLVTGYAEYGGE